MDSFFGGSKSSLHETVKAQQDRLAKYEKKLGDLVKAYKILQEEKKALQDTVNAFSAHPPEISKFICFFFCIVRPFRLKRLFGPLFLHTDSANVEKI